MVIQILFCYAIFVPGINWPGSNCAIMRVSRHFCGGAADWTDQQRRCVSRRAASYRHFFSAGKAALGDGRFAMGRPPAVMHSPYHFCCLFTVVVYCRFVQ
jgi:hypothetical protein